MLHVCATWGDSVFRLFRVGDILPDDNLPRDILPLDILPHNILPHEILVLQQQNDELCNYYI